MLENGTTRSEFTSIVNVTADADAKRGVVRIRAFSPTDDSVRTERWFVNESGVALKRINQTTGIDYARFGYSSYDEFHTGAGSSRLIRQIVEGGLGNWTLANTTTRDGHTYFTYTTPTRRFVVRDDGLVVEVYSEAGNTFYLRITPTEASVSAPSWVPTARNETAG
ncbi:MAG: hypothetical protein ABEI99_11235 [Halobaculum sp.]